MILKKISINLMKKYSLKGTFNLCSEMLIHEGEEHSHSHEHLHDHGHSHDHDHGCTHSCSSCAGCDPMQETLALMQYMVNHNAAHARELAELAGKLKELGNETASAQVLTAVSEFEKGNLRLSAVLSSLK